MGVGGCGCLRIIVYSVLCFYREEESCGEVIYICDIVIVVV